MSKEKAARIANVGRSTSGKKGEKSPKYEEWTKKDLYNKARQIGIGGISKMNKGQPIGALRSH